MNRKFKEWEEFEESLNITDEEEAKINLEMDIIRATIKARQQANLSQSELSRKTGIKQPAIARVENGTHSPTISTLIKLLVPIGYTLKVVPLNKKVKSK